MAGYDGADSPRQWALAQAGLGSALHWLSNSETGTGSLLKSVAARRAALEVLTMEDAPVDWANAQNGIAMSLINLGTREQTAKYFAEVEDALTQSLKVFTREKQPLQWAFGQNNLGDAYWNRASLGGGKPDYETAKRHFELAKQGFSESGYTAPIALTDKKIELVDKAIADQ